MKSKQEVEGIVYDILTELSGISVDDIKSTSNIVLDLNTDSLDTVHMINMLEEQFTLAISDSAAENLVTVADVVEYCCKHQGTGHEL
jgi:acyl carrier protein